jgi:hypothetical protein
MKCYCPCWKHSHSALATRYSKFLMFSVCAVVEQPVAPTNSHPAHPPIASRPHTKSHTPNTSSSGIILQSVCIYFPKDQYLASRIFIISPSTRSTLIIFKSATVIYFHVFSSYFINHLCSWLLLNKPKKEANHIHTVTLLLCVASWQSKTATVAATKTGQGAMSAVVKALKTAITSWWLNGQPPACCTVQPPSSDQTRLQEFISWLVIPVRRKHRKNIFTNSSQYVMIAEKHCAHFKLN